MWGWVGEVVVILVQPLEEEEEGVVVVVVALGVRGRGSRLLIRR